MKTLLTLLCLVIAPMVLTGGILPSQISANMVLDIAGSPYQVAGNVTIAKGVTVIVNPGVVLKSTGNFGLQVNGTLRMLGKKDSLIYADSVYIQFNAGAVGYNPKTSSGSLFNYVRFNCAQSGNPFAIRSSKAHVYASHCQFLRVNNAIYATTDSVNITVLNSKIIGFTNGYSIYNTYSNWDLEMQEDTIINGGYLYMGAHNRVEKCLFLGGTNTYYGLYGQSYTKSATIACNYFNRISYSINLSSMSTNHGFISIYNNVVDSANYGIYFARDFNSDSVSVSNNAFLKCDYAIYCLSSISGSTIPKGLNCKNNWWNTTDSVKIKALTYDHRDNQYVIPNIQFLPMLTNPPNLCGPSYGNYGKTSHAVGVLKLPIKISPNPTHGDIEIAGDFNGPLAWQLYNSNGRLIRNGILYNEKKINDLKGPGVYILKLFPNNAPGQTFRVMYSEL